MEALKVRAEGVCKAFRRRNGPAVAALEAVNLFVPEGGFVTVSGRPATGKTTLLRLLAGLERPDSGTVQIRHCQAERPLTSLVFQDFALLPWMTVAENISYGLRLRHWPHEHRRDAAEHYARRLDLWRHLDSYPHRLSPADQQRVSLARALANDPEVLLLDDPMAAQETAEQRLLVRRELGRIRGTRRCTVLYAARQAEETAGWHDHVLELQ